MMRHNWFPNPTGTPKPGGTINVKSMRSDGTWMYFEPESTTDGTYIIWYVTGLPVGRRLAMLVSLGSVAGKEFVGPILEVRDTSGDGNKLAASPSTAADGARLRIEFTVPPSGRIGLILRGKVGETTGFASPILTEAGSDESYFDGDTMPLN